MKNSLHLAAISVNQTPLAWTANKGRLKTALDHAKSLGARWICYPELCISGYGCEDAFFAADTARRSLDVLLELLPETKGVVALFGLPLLVDELLYNTVAVAADGVLLGFAAKHYLAGEGIHYEPRWFSPWPLGFERLVNVGGQQVPIGSLAFQHEGVTFGVEVCEDAWVSERMGVHLAKKGVKLIFNASASHFAFQKQARRRAIVREGATRFGVVYVYTNLLGNEAGRAIYDGTSMIAIPSGEVRESKRFSFSDYQIFSEKVEISKTLKFLSKPGAGENSQPQWEESFHIQEEEFARAVGLGLFDYVRKSASRGCVVSLSGGADSAVVSVLISIMVKLAIAELGLDDFLKKFGRSDLVGRVKTEQEVLQHTLLTVYQKTKNSGPVTENAARQVADAIGAEFHSVDISELVSHYVALAEVTEHRELQWSRDDVALQNIQARTRGPFVWLLANLRGYLLLSTSNRSEAAVGYATMDGDTCGGLSPIAGVDKAFLLRWLKWMERIGPEGVGAMPVLSAITKQAPTAELRPPSESQTDEVDLMPYSVLAYIERLAVRDKKSPKEIQPLLREAFPEFSQKDQKIWIRRFFTLWARNQWKRERYAPSFHLDEASLDPKTWCRFPILSGGYVDELQDL